MTYIFSQNITFTQLLLAHFARANKARDFSISGTLGADGLEVYKLHRVPLKNYIWLHYQPKRVVSIVNCHSFTNVPVCEECIECIFVFLIQVLEFQKVNSDHLGKRKIRHTTSVAIF